MDDFQCFLRKILAIPKTRDYIHIVYKKGENFMNDLQLREDIFSKLVELVPDSTALKAILPLLTKLESDAYTRGVNSAQEEIKKMKSRALADTPENALIMVIDDNEEILAMLEQLLSQGGYQVITGKSGEDCMRLLQANKPDVLVLDINLKDSDGESIVDYLRHQFETRFLPVVFVSGLIGSEEVKELNQSEDSKRHHKRFLSKPFDIPDLFNTIEELRQAQRIAGELPWTPPLPKEINFSNIPVKSTKEYPGNYKETRALTLKERIEEYLGEGYIPSGFEYIVIELLSRGKVRVEMEGYAERLSLEDIEHHMITAYAAELFNRYYPQRAVPSYMLDVSSSKNITSGSRPINQTQRISLKKKTDRLA